MLGMMIESYKDVKRTPIEAWFMFALSPFILPILIGVMLAENKPKE
jgi:hypothetical protein